MRVDKTLSELWSISDHENETVREIVKMAINTIHKMEEEHDKFVKTSYETIKREEEKANSYEKALREIESNIEVVNWKQSIKIAREALNKKSRLKKCKTCGRTDKCRCYVKELEI